MAAFNPSPTKPIVSYPTPIPLDDQQVITLHDTRLSDYSALAYGTLHPDQGKFPGLQLVFQGPVGEDDKFVRRVWAADRNNQDLYNDSRKYSSGSTLCPIIIRKYVVPEATYTPLATGTPDPVDAGAFLVDEEVTRPENLNGYLQVTRVFETLPGPALTGFIITNEGQLAITKSQSVVPGTTVTPSALLISGSVKPDSDGKSVLETIEVPSVFDAKSYSIEAPDPVPQKFRIAAPAITTWETVAGTAVAPVLATGELEASEQQATVFTKKLRKTSRNTTSLPQTLTQTATTNEGQKAVITETLQVGDTTASPTATTTIESEAMGDGTYVVKETAVPTVFDQKSFSIEVPDPAPQKFRIKAPAITTEETLVGTAAAPVLATGEISASEQQVTVFTKRNRKTARSTTALPQTLTQTATTNEGLKATITETFQVGDTTASPTATTTIESEAIGDGTYVVKATTVPKVFDQEARSKQKPDVIPERYRASVPSETHVTVQASASAVAPLILNANEIEKSEQRVTEFTSKTSVTTRVISTLPTLRGQDYDPSTGALIPYTEKVVASGASSGAPLTDINPLSDTLDLARTIDTAALTASLASVHLQFPSRTTLSLPPVLMSVSVVWDTSNEDGNFASDWSGYATGKSYSLSGSERGESRSVASVTPNFTTRMRDTWATNIPTTSHVFFLPLPCTEAQILAKVSASKWPTFHPESHTIVAFGQKVAVSAEGSAAASKSYSEYEDKNGVIKTNEMHDVTRGQGTSYGISTTSVVNNIPPCLHGSINVSGGTPTSSATASTNIGWSGSNFPSVYVHEVSTGVASGSVHGGSLSPTTPSDIPRSGTYLIDSRVELYQHGYVKVYAEVLDASILA